MVWEVKPWCDQAIEWDHPPGWRHIVQALCGGMLHVLGENGLSTEDVAFHQLKMKYGGMRAYLDVSERVPHSVAADVAKMVRMAEEASVRTCERCGHPGRRLMIGRWTYTLCPDHAEEMRRA